MKNPYIIVLLIIALGAYLLFFEEKLPVKYYICGKGYVDCRLIAKFDDMQSCQTTEQKWGWYCDQTDKSRIICQENESDVTDSYCTE